MRILLPLFLFLLLSPVYADLLLFSDDNDFHGCLDCSKYDSNSVCNRYGEYGSKYNSNSIWSKYGIGSKYNSSSPFSKYGNGLKVIDSDGSFYGYFSSGYSGEQKFRKLLNNLWDATDGDYDSMQKIFCSDGLLGS